MFSPKMIPYQPNAATRARRIDPKEWERLRPRLEELYVNEDKKLEEVMEVMSLSGFHASRRQYTQKLNDWGLYKNVSSKVMKCALRKRARAAGHDVSIKYRGTAITEENMDRWQKRVSTFNPFSSPTASTPSQLNVDSPHVALPAQHGETVQSPVAQSQPINLYHEITVASDDEDGDVLNSACNEVRRSVSPQVAQYIFRREDSSSSATRKGLVAAGWTSMRILALSVNESELLQLTEETQKDLMRLATHIWKLGNRQSLVYYAQILEVLLARTSLSAPVNVGMLYQRRLLVQLALAYLHMNRASESEALLTAAIIPTGLAWLDDPLSYECRSVLGMLRSQAGQHDSAIALCTQAEMSLRSRLGLSHYATWQAHHLSVVVLRNQGEIQKVETLRLDFFVDIYRSVSAQLLPGLCASLELCETYIQTWMPETRLQRLARSHYPSDLPLDISQTQFLMLKAVVTAGFETTASKPVSNVLGDLESWTGLGPTDILWNCVKLVNRRINPVQPLEPSSLRQNALQVVKDLKVTKFLVPLFVFTWLATTYEVNSNTKRNERNLIVFLEKLVTDSTNAKDAYIPNSSDDTGSSGVASAVGEGHYISRSDPLDGPESFPVISKLAALGPLWKDSSTSQGSFNGIATAGALPWATINQPGSGLPTAFVQTHTNASLGPMADDIRRTELSVDVEMSDHQSQPSVHSAHWFPTSATFLRPDPLYPEYQSSHAQSGHWLLPSATFLRPGLLHPEYQPENDPRLQNRVPAVVDLSSNEIDHLHLGTEASLVPQIASFEDWSGQF